jgi:hypothetical protein
MGAIVPGWAALALCRRWAVGCDVVGVEFELLSDGVCCEDGVGGLARAALTRRLCRQIRSRRAEGSEIRRSTLRLPVSRSSHLPLFLSPTTTGRLGDSLPTSRRGLWRLRPTCRR